MSEASVLFVLVHYHGHGVDAALVTGPPGMLPEDAVAQAGFDYEPDKGEWVELVPMADRLMYVVLNASRPYEYSFGRPGEHCVMPAEDPHTYGALDDAAGQVATLMAEYGHTVETAPIYCLAPVPRALVEEAMARAQARLAEEEAAWV